MNTNSVNNTTDKGKQSKNEKNNNLKVNNNINQQNLYNKYLEQLEFKFIELEKEVRDIPISIHFY